MSARSLYRSLLFLYPAAFREEYGTQMLLVFAEQLDQARQERSWRQEAALWMRTAFDILLVAPREHLHLVAQDLRYAFRMMATAPTFAIVAIVTLALGIGANTAIFSLWNGVLYAPLPGVRDAAGLVMLTNPDDSGSWTGRWDASDGPRSWVTYSEFEDLRDRATSFSGVMASQSRLESWQARAGGGDWEEVRGRMVSGGFFELLGVKPAIGRLFTPAEDRGDPLNAVISYSYWQRKFGGNPDVLGKPLTIRKAVLTIVGVAPAGFTGETASQQPDLWLPIRTAPAVLPGRNLLRDTPPEKAMWLHVFARLKPGVTYAQAETESNTVLQANLEAFYGPSILMGERRREFLDQRLRLQSGARGASSARNALGQSLTALLAAVAVLLLIACANIASLLLARGAARKPEIALRLSLGARRSRLMRQLVTESLTLAVAGGLGALVVAYGLFNGLEWMLAQVDSRFGVGFSTSPLVMAFVVATTIGAALLFGVLPAWQATRTSAAESLKEQTRGATGSFVHARSGKLLVSLQLALTLPLLVGAGLLVRTTYNLQHASVGFRNEHLLLVRLDFREVKADETTVNNQSGELLRQIKLIPGVQAVSFSELGLFTGGESSSTLNIEGYVPKGDRDRGSAQDSVGPGYFTTLGVPITLGRDIQESDRADGPRVCVINEAFAKQFFEGRNPIGMRLTVVGDGTNKVDYHVVGVARDAHLQSVRSVIVPRFFVAAVQPPNGVDRPIMLIRTATDSPVMPAVRRAVEQVNAGLPILSAKSIAEQMEPITAQDRVTATLALVFALVAMVLAAIGLYGLLSYGVTRRTGEIALRIALGAVPTRVIAMIVRETLSLLGIGLAAGLGLAYVAGRLIDSRLYGVAPRDLPTMVLAAGLLLVVALAAAFLPARRASKLDPQAALRQA